MGVSNNLIKCRIIAPCMLHLSTWLTHLANLKYFLVLNFCRRRVSNQVALQIHRASRGFEG